MPRTRDNLKATPQRAAGPSFRRSCVLGLGVGAATFALWSASFLLDDQPVGHPAWILAAVGSTLIALAYGHLRLRLACARRQDPAGLELFHRLTRDLPVMLYQFRQYPTGRTSVTQASDAIRTIYELTPEEARKNGVAIIDLVHPEDRDRIWKSLVKTYRDLTPWHQEYRVVLPQAGTVWRAAHARVQRMPDGGTLWHGFIIDIDDQKRGAAELEAQRCRAETADRAKSEFLAMMSHDIRTPMSAVLGFADLLNDTSLTENQREFLSSIRTSGETLLLLINEILDLSRVESGTLELNESSFFPPRVARRPLQHPDLPRGRRKESSFTPRSSPGPPEAFTPTAPVSPRSSKTSARTPSSSPTKGASTSASLRQTAPPRTPSSGHSPSRTPASAFPPRRSPCSSSRSARLGTAMPVVRMGSASASRSPGASARKWAATSPSAADSAPEPA